MKHCLTFILTIMLLNSCIPTVQTACEIEELSLSTVLYELSLIGDLSAIAATSINLNKYFKGETELTYYLVNEGNVSNPECQATTYRTGDTKLKNYLSNVGLTEEQFLSHPKLEKFILSHLVLGREFNYVQNRTDQYLDVLGNAITVKSEMSTATGIDFYINDSFVSHCNYDSGFDESTRVRLCYVDKPIINNFDWSQ